MQSILSSFNEIFSFLRSQVEKNVSVVSAMKQAPGSDKKTFDQDEFLPPLPLPDLDHTLDRYLDSVRPFASPEMMRETEAIVKDFRAGVGKELHQKLRQKADSEKNWLERWWEDKAYLENRSPLLPFCAMMGSIPLEDLYTTFESDNMIERASLLLYYMCDLWMLLRTERLTTFVDRKNVFTMHQFRRLYNCTRTPLPQRDQIETYFKTEKEGDCPSHLIVLCNGHIFCVDTTFEGSLLTPPEWEKQLGYILDSATSEGPGTGVGCLTCDQRDTWAVNRKHLENLSAENRRILQVINTATQTLMLMHDREPKTKSEVITVPASCYSNVWADKSSQLLVWGNGHCTPFGDHTAYDGNTSVTCAFYMYQNMKESGGKWTGAKTTRNLPLPEKLEFKVDDVLRVEMDRCRAEQRINEGKVRMFRTIFPDFGKEFLKKHRVHPDAFAQLAIQLSYYRIHGKPASCYETATTRSFYHGRTETLRTCTVEVMDWVKAMQSEGTQDSEKIRLLRVAADRLLYLMKEAKENAGCDRHLFGLFCVALENKMAPPAIFTDPLYALSGGTGNFILSTSLIGYTPIGGVVAPMCEEGYGCFYNYRPNQVHFSMSEMRSCPNTDADRFAETIFSSLWEMQRLLLSEPR